MFLDCTAGSSDLNLWLDRDGIILTATQREVMCEWMFLHLVCDINYWASESQLKESDQWRCYEWSYPGMSACRWAALLDPGCRSGPNLRKSLWHSNPVKIWHIQALKTTWKLIIPVHIDGTHFSDIRVANAASLALMLQERAEPSLLFLRARIAMILQILRTERHQETRGLFYRPLYHYPWWCAETKHTLPCSDICLCSQILSTLSALRSVSKGTWSICSSR